MARLLRHGPVHEADELSKIVSSDCGEACLSYGGSGDWENEVCTDTLDAYVVECEPNATAPVLSPLPLSILGVLLLAGGWLALEKRASRSI